MRHIALITGLITVSLAMAACNPSANSSGDSTPSGISSGNKSLKLSTSGSIANKCFVELCGSTMSDKPLLIDELKKAVIPSADQKKYYDTYLKPALKENEENKRARSMMYYRQLLAREANFKSVKLTDSQTQLLHFFVMLKKIKENKNLNNYFGQQLINTEFFKAFMSFSTMGKWTYIQSLHPNKPPQTAVSDELAMYDSIAAKLNNDMGSPLAKLNPLIVAKIKSQQMLSVDEVEEFSAAAQSLRLVSHFVYEDTPGHILVVSDLKSNPTSVQSLLDIYKSGDLKSRLWTAAYKYTKDLCEYKYYLSINLYPQQSEIDNFKNKVELVRAAALAQLSSQDPAYEKVSKIKIVLPQTASENSLSWLRSLKSKNTELAYETNLIQESSDTTLFALAAMNTLNPENDKEDQCPNVPDSDISDKTSTLSSFLMVSWYSVRHPDMGVGIVAHEIGHNVYAYSESAKTPKQCLIDKQDSELYANEDFADLFATKVIETLERNNNLKTNNYACVLVMDGGEQGLTNPQKDDVHSADLYRAIQYAVHRKQEVPQSCVTLANNEKPKTLNSCQY